MAPKIIYQSPQWDGRNKYSNETIFNLETYGFLKMLYLVFAVTPQDAIALPAGTGFATPTSPYIIKSVTLESFGNVIARIDKDYMLARLDELNSDDYSQISDGARIDGVAFVVPKTVTLPLFFWPLDGQSIDTFKYPNLTIRCITESSFENMGFSDDIVDIRTQLKMIYDRPDTYVPRELDFKKSYNMYSNETYPISLNTTSTSIKLNVPFKVTNLYFLISQNDAVTNYSRIYSVKLTSPSETIGIYESSTDYTMGAFKSSNNIEGTVFAINFAARKSSEGVMRFNGMMNPIIAELEFATSANDRTLRVVYDYNSEIVHENGMLLEEVGGSFK